ncbi:MAG: erythromycin esterase family protein [Bacteroidota bacterium]
MKLANCLLLVAVGWSLLSCQEVENSAPGCGPTETEQAVVDALDAGLAYPFQSANPEIEDSQLQPLIDYLADTKFVGLGEATHGTAEFFQLKDKLFRLLVTQAGFKAIIFEIPWGNALKVNDFVTKGIGTADEVINQTWYWVYDTEEVRALAQWVHDYNEDLAEEEKIFFVGCDPQGPDFALERQQLREYLYHTDPDSERVVLDYYAQLPGGDLPAYSNASAATHEANRVGTQAVYDYMLRHADRLIANSSELDYQIALMSAHVIQQREHMYRINNFGETRDELMATYSEWWQRVLGEDSKVAIWAHNRHVWDAGLLNSNWMGTFLTNRQGAENYRTVGFSFSRGTFNAFLADSNSEFAGFNRRHIIEEPLCGTVNHLLQEVAGEQHYLIFDEFSGSAFDYFQAAQRFTQTGAGFNIDFIENYTQAIPLSRVYDVLIHFDNTRASVLQ